MPQKKIQMNRKKSGHLSEMKKKEPEKKEEEKNIRSTSYTTEVLGREEKWEPLVRDLIPYRFESDIFTFTASDRILFESHADGTRNIQLLLLKDTLS